jgi:hypothetical protein
LFLRVFRKGGTPSPDMLDYFERCFFTAPAYDPALGSLVHRGEDGAIEAALLIIPMQVRAAGKLMTGRLAGNYMTDPGRRTRGGAEMVLTLRPRYQDFCFADSSNPVSAGHWRAIGGVSLPVQSLDWRLLFRPAQWLLRERGRSLPGWLRRGLQPAAQLGDAGLRRVLPALRAGGPGRGAPMTHADFIAAAPGLLERFALRPAWSADELGWLLDLAGRNRIHGALQLRQLLDDRGELAGCSAFYARPGGMALVLNILARPRRELAVVADLVAHLREMGCLGARGLAQPFLMPALAAQQGMSFVPRGTYCFSTRHREVIDAALRGDAYLGGLMGEDWSRLLDEFRD